jgi:putative peptidoglycan lipid II flippase
VPSAVAFLALGDVLVAAIYQSGRFTHDDALYVWSVLAGAAVGLLASALGRLYTSTYYALHDTRTPLYYAIVRVILTTMLGYLCALPLPTALGIEARWGVAGLTASAGLAGWVEFALLRHTLNRKIGRTGLPASFLAQLWSAAAAGAAAVWAVKVALGPRHPILVAVLILAPYGVIYVAITYGWGLSEAQAVVRWVTRLVCRPTNQV